MGKKHGAKRDVWVPRPVIIEIGETEYEVVAQPMRRYIEFEERLRELLEGFVPPELGGDEGAGADEAAGDELAGPKGAVGPAGDRGVRVIPAEETELSDEAIAKGLVERGVEVVYEILKCVIPGLEYEDVLDAPEPQLEHAIEVCLKVNGGRWAESLIRDFFGPLLPVLQGMLADWLLTRTAPTEAEEPTPTETGEAPPTTS